MISPPDNKSPAFQEELYRDMLFHAPIGIVQSTLDGKLIYANPAVARMLGYSSTEECLASIQNIALDMYVDSDRRTTLIDLVLERGKLLNFESKLRRKNGRIFIGKFNVRLARDSCGVASHLEGFIEDISQQKEAETALRVSEERYRSVFENTGAGTIIIESDTTISLINAGFETLTGYSKEEIEGKMKWGTIVANAEDRTRMRQYHFMRRTATTAIPIEYEFTLKDRTGIDKNVFIRVDVIPGTDKSVASMTDISTLKKAERSFRESQSKLVGVMEAFEGFIYTTSQNHNISYMNRALENFVDTDSVERKCYLLIYDLDEPCPWCPLKRVFSGETIKEEFRNPKDGRWYYGVSSPIYKEDEDVEMCQAVLIDVNERKVAILAMKERKEYLQKENSRLRATIEDRYKFGDIVGKSAAMQQVYKMILRAAATDANVIIYGETGTGKELVARAIHRLSDRNKHALVPINCGAIPQELMESELFGYKKGAFTNAAEDKQGVFDHADKGSLFLDELGEVSESMQIKLLRVLEGHGYIPVGGVETIKPDVRIIAATNRNLQQLVEDGSLREDFFYRVHIIPIHLPPLRDRKGDIPLLIEHFLKKQEGKDGVPTLRGWEFEALLAHHWPGNIRELENTLQRYVSLHHLDLLMPKKQSEIVAESISAKELAFTDITLRCAVDNFEKKFIVKMLEKYRWNRTRVAKHLQIERKTLYSKMQRFGIEQDKL
ncbi:MAG: Fis family transcriptional regulator [Desulfotalea sp.]|nr:MAG: Fis family transcriptional regulator [Desulfotalea sp.]